LASENGGCAYKCLAVEKENVIRWRFIKEKKDAAVIDTRSETDSSQTTENRSQSVL